MSRERHQDPGPGARLRGVEQSVDRAFVVTFAPGEVRRAAQRHRKRLSGIAAGSQPATGDSARITRLALRHAEHLISRHATLQRGEAGRIAFGHVQTWRPEGPAYDEDGWAEAGALAEHLDDDGLRLDLPDGGELVVEVLSKHEVRVEWADLPGAPFASLADYVRAFELAHAHDRACRNCLQKELVACPTTIRSRP